MTRALVLLLLLSACGPSEKTAGVPAAAPFDLSDVMLKLQVHAGKLAFAADAENWDLARFYVDQIEEDIRPLAAGEIMAGTTNVSDTARTLFPPLLTRLREATLDRDAAAFQQRYLDLVQGCNSCHRATGHAYVVIERPEGGVFGNQRY
ncbi:MAG: hypothetical protein ACRD2J_15285 [Thermoanaerobaculia bacterium]